MRFNPTDPQPRYMAWHIDRETGRETYLGVLTHRQVKVYESYGHLLSTLPLLTQGRPARRIDHP